MEAASAMEDLQPEADEIAAHFAKLARAAAPGAEEKVEAPGELDAACALLAWGLAPERPRAESRARLLARLSALGAASAPAARPAPAPVVDLGAFARREQRAWRAVRLLAAALALAVGGLVYLAGRLSAESTRLAETAELTARLEREEAEKAAQLEVAGRRIHMVTSVARYAYRMQSVAAAPAFTAGDRPPQGMVYVCSHHQQWILSLEHLAPPPPGRAYHVQFRTADGVVDGGILRVGADARAGMEDVKLPPGTRGFSVTLEPEGVAGDPLLVLQSQPGVPL